MSDHEIINDVTLFEDGEPKLLRICVAHGDIILLVNGKVRLLVSSVVMSIVSKPFAAMLSDKYMEG